MSLSSLFYQSHSQISASPPISYPRNPLQTQIYHSTQSSSHLSACIARNAHETQIYWCDLFDNGRHSDDFREKMNIQDVQYLLNPGTWRGSIVGVLSCDNNAHLSQQLEYCTHLGLNVIVIKEYLSDVADLVALARTLKQASLVSFIWCRVRLTDEDSDWVAWNQLRFLCGIDSILVQSQLGLVLEMSEELPDSVQVLVDRWMAEPLMAISVGVSAFGSQVGTPVLSPMHAHVLREVTQFDDFSVVLRSNQSFVEEEDEFLRVAPQYLESIQNEYYMLPPVNELQSQVRGYANVLQTPLQPLHNHLSSQTYENFEQDPVKYQLYEQAIARAMEGRMRVGDSQEVGNLPTGIATVKNSTVQTNSTPTPTLPAPLIVMILGAGRGPLVESSMRAMLSVCPKAPVKFYAIEKNPHCLLLLRKMRDAYWSEFDVEIVHQDMRTWKPTQLADIIVSELLGSFGDNELSPECLDGAQHLLKEGGISIPQKYTSYLVPVSSLHLHQAMSGMQTRDAFDKGYVVNAQRAFRIAPPQPVFTFEHPTQQIGQNDRYCKLLFKTQEQCLFTGLCGYFECVLYEDILMSIRPETHSPEMISWFPIYFPLRHSVVLVAGEQVCVHFWRVSDEAKVWYEWSVCTETQQSEIYNSNGSVYYMLK